MQVRIAEEKVNEIRQAVDIVDVVSEHVQLKKQGRNYFGLCPFHGESTPSFSVSPEKQIYHCFGCGAGGNVFSFLMDIESISFQEAAVKLAEKGNIELDIAVSSISQTESPISKELRQMIEAHDLIRKFYHHLLVNTKDGQHALEYLLNRGFTLEAIEKFQIGYALHSWDFVYKFLTKRKFDAHILEKAGLIIKRENEEGYFDRFRDRIMFPIFDHKGNTIAFSGRTLGASAGEPKYLNSPETAIFNKSKILYNFHLAKSNIRRQQQIILFEGFADCIAADRAGIENGVATMGTSLTNEHIALIRRNTQSVTICYDSDNAGIEAAYRAANLLTEAGLQVRIALLSEGLDPDDFINKHGKAKFNDLLSSSLTFMSFKLVYFRKGKDLQNEGDRLQYIEEVLKEISQLDKAVERDHYLRQLSQEFSLSLDALKEQQRQTYFSIKRNNKGKENRNKDLSFTPIKQSESLRPAFHNAERRLIYHMMRDPNVAYKVQEMLAGQHFNIDEHQAIITYLYGFLESGAEPNPSDFMNTLKDDKLKRIVADIEMMSINEEISEQELTDYINQVLKQQKMLKIKAKEKERQAAEREGNFKEAAMIAMEIIELQKTI